MASSPPWRRASRVVVLTSALGLLLAGLLTWLQRLDRLAPFERAMPTSMLRLESAPFAVLSQACPSLIVAARSCHYISKRTPVSIRTSTRPRIDLLLSTWGADAGHVRQRRLGQWEQFEALQLSGLARDHEASVANRATCAESAAQAAKCITENGLVMRVNEQAGASTSLTSDTRVILDALEPDLASSVLGDSKAQAILSVMRGQQQEISLTRFGLERRLHRGPPPLGREDGYPSNDCYFADSPSWDTYFSRKQIDQAHQASIAAGSSQQGTWRCMPTVFVMGAQKASSTELRAWMVRHPWIQPVAPWTMEPHILTTLNTYQWPAAAFLAQGVLSAGDIEIGKRLMDKTPGYLHFSPVAGKMAKLFPRTVRLIVLLRDPAERLISGLWNVCLFRGTDCARAHVESVALQTAMTTTLWGNVWNSLVSSLEQQLDIGRYDKHLSNFERAFVDHSDARLYVGFAENFKRDPVRAMFQIETFLDLPHVPYDSVAHGDSATSFKTVSNATLKFNVQHVDKFEKSKPEVYDEIRAKYYADSIINVCRLLKKTRPSGRGLQWMVEEDWPQWVQVC